jgi:flagellar biosynthesis/type III secretory pathway protein FliH
MEGDKERLSAELLTVTTQRDALAVHNERMDTEMRRLQNALDTAAKEAYERGYEHGYEAGYTTATDDSYHPSV